VLAVISVLRFLIVCGLLAVLGVVSVAVVAVALWLFA
jgi:hypothetical protein